MDVDGDKWFHYSHSHPAQNERKPNDKIFSLKNQLPFGANLVLLPNTKHETYKTMTLCKGFLVRCRFLLGKEINGLWWFQRGVGGWVGGGASATQGP